MAYRNALRLDRKSGKHPPPTLGENVVQQHGVETADHEIAVRMHVVIVGDRLNAEVAFRAKQDFVGDRATEGADPPAAKVGEGAETRRIGIAHAQDFPKLVVGNGGAMVSRACRRVFDPAQADFGIAALDGLIDGGKRNVDETRLCARDRAR